MFLHALLEQNPALAEFTLKCHRQGTLLPDTWVLDMDTIEENAALMLKEAKQHNISLYFMLKQIGRIPAIGNRLANMGFSGAVCVDFREALTMLENGVPLGNVGHLVQIPQAALQTILAARPQIMTVYSLEKAKEISTICQKTGITQDIMLRVIAPGDTLYSGQYGGFYLDTLEQAAQELEALPGIRIAGVCSFPCFLYDEHTQDIQPTPNAATVRKAARLLEARGHSNLQLNMPSATCAHSIPKLAAEGATHGEPGHGLTGSTPWHAALPNQQQAPPAPNHAHTGNSPERLAYVYLSEVSHTMDGKGYCYGGGHYRRGHMRHALVDNGATGSLCKVWEPSLESIDYHFELENPAEISRAVLLCFRTQIFVTRSEVALVSGLRHGSPRIEGIYSSQGYLLRQA